MKKQKEPISEEQINTLPNFEYNGKVYKVNSEDPSFPKPDFKKFKYDSKTYHYGKQIVYGKDDIGFVPEWVEIQALLIDEIDAYDYALKKINAILANKELEKVSKKNPDIKVPDLNMIIYASENWIKKAATSKNIKKVKTELSEHGIILRTWLAKINMFEMLYSGEETKKMREKKQTLTQKVESELKKAEKKKHGAIKEPKINMSDVGKERKKFGRKRKEVMKWQKHNEL